MTQTTMREQWSSHTGFILAAIGGAVGLGNIWKFPYMAGSSGGGAFVIVYLFAVALVAIPILTAELMLGRSGRQSPPTAMLINAEKENRSRWWSGVGWIGAGAGFLILTFYSVVGGWVLDYVFVSVTGGFSAIEPAGAQARFGSILSNPLRMMLSFTLFLGITGIIISAGLRNGIERATGILMPALFLMLLVLIAYSAVKGDMAAGFSFLFTVDFGSVLSFNIWAEVKPVAGKTIFDLVDYLTANLMMPIGGMLIAIFAGWFMRRNTLADELQISSSWLFQTWRFLIRSVVPLAIAGILVTNLL